MMLPGKWKDWDIIEDIGSGSYGTVYQIECEDEVKAVKIIEIPQKDEYNLIMKEHGQDAEAYCRSIAQDFEAEINTLMLLRDCENIIHIEDYVIEKKKDDIGWTIYIFMDCLSSFTEYALMHEINEAEIIRLGEEIANALMACEKQGIIHRDIKPENILVTDEGRYLLCDFGLARKLNYKELANSVKGTYKYMAPEVYHGKSYNNTVDIYSLGLIMYQYMNKRRSIFLPLDKKTIYFKDQEEALQMRMDNSPVPDPVEASPEFADIIKRMIAYDPEERYQTADKLKKDLILLREGRYRKKKSFSFKNYRKQIAAAGLILLCSASYLGWTQSTVFKNASCGENTVAALTNDGTLRISGSGDVSDGSAWLDHSQKIKKVVLEGEITSLDAEGSGILSDCPNLRSVELPESLEVLGDNAFANDPKLEDITIKGTLTEIGNDAFYNTGWEKKHVDEKGFVIVDGILVGYTGQETDLVIPESVKEIGGSVFTCHPEIRSLRIGDQVEYIGQEAFAECENLTDVIFGKGITEIGPNAFSGTPWLNNQEWAVANGILLKYNGEAENISLPQEVKVVGIEAFASNPYIKKIRLPGHVEWVCQFAFAACDHLESVEIEGPLTDIEYSTFSECSSLNHVSLPASLKRIGSHAFYKCVRLKEIRIPKGTELLDTFYEYETGAPFDGCDVKIIEC